MRVRGQQEGHCPGAASFREIKKDFVHSHSRKPNADYLKNAATHETSGVSF